MGKKWNLLAVIAAFLLCFTFIFEENRTRSENYLQLPQETLQLIEDEISSLEIESNKFHIYARNHQQQFQSYDEVVKYLKQWKIDERVDWIVEETEEQIKWLGKNTESNSYKEKISIIVTPYNNGQFDAYTIYEASFSPSPQWQETYSELFTSKLTPFDAEDIFLRVEGSILGENADVKQWGTTILESLSAEVVEDIQEESFVSYSAYTPLWGQEIMTNGGKMNVQIALREVNDGMGGETTVTIGTPLITTEY
ncbi:YwmB family TATA-box binding protein [Evansella sp. AB-rgal1]|uniref:YwmB family TATA-box binding protein n=1 Tax=Evansella sp. AB-rgal1 TaxID=3242696 RepID=UPI00359E376D